MTYSERLGCVFMSVGSDLGSWDGPNWTLTAGPLPVVRNFAFGLAYDERRARLVLFGGYDSWLVAQRDTWEFDGQSWTRGPDGPQFQCGNRLVYDSFRQRCVTIGTPVSGPMETWEYDGLAWTHIPQVEAPGPRESFAATYDPLRRRIALFGGGLVDLPTRAIYVGGGRGDLWFLGRPQDIRPVVRDVPVGQPLQFTLQGAVPGAVFLAGLAQSTAPAIALPLPGGRVVWPLAPDQLWRITFGLPGLVGSLNAAGQGAFALPTPHDPALAGLRMFASAVFFGATGAPSEVTNETQVLLVR